MEKRLILAIGLSILVILVFQRFVPQPKRTEPVARPQVQSNATPLQEKPSRELIKLPEAKEKETVVETDKYILTFSSKGGSLKKIVLKNYTAPGKNTPLELVSGAEGTRAIFAMQSNVLTDLLPDREFKLEQQDRNKLVYKYAESGNFEITKEYKFYKTNDYIELRVLINNIGDATIYRDYDLLGASSMQQADNVMGRKFIEIDSMVDGKLAKKTSVKNGESFISGIISWTGVKERYFCIILKPQQDSEGVVIKQFDKSNLASGIRTRRLPIYKGASIQDDYMLYIGPNDMATLKSLGLEQIMNYGFFGGITKVLLVVLRSIHKVVKNWGLAIILLTFCINLILFPLTKKSFLSMRKMQEVQPHIEKLRKLHKDNPQKMNKELAELYRQYNINPFGGCLPLLLQMPIFIALYQGLMGSIELKGANFLWIKDLSSPDLVSLPFTLPIIGNELHILPLLMVGAMFFQQKISTKNTPTMGEDQQKQQRFMLIFFPLFFGFLFYNFPSGLVLYWLTNTVLMVIEQTSIRKAVSG